MDRDLSGNIKVSYYNGLYMLKGTDIYGREQRIILDDEEFRNLIQYKKDVEDGPND